MTAPNLTSTFFRDTPGDCCGYSLRECCPDVLHVRASTVYADPVKGEGLHWQPPRRGHGQADW